MNAYAPSPRKLAILALTPRGAELGGRLAARLPEAELFVPEKLAAVAPSAHPFAGALAEWVAALWTECDGFVCIMATGIVVRTVAPLLRGKGVDPAVVVVDEAGQFAISLLSGHLGGANQLARDVATLCRGTAVITTATDVNGLLAWDEAARRAGLRPEPLDNIRKLNSFLLEGKKVSLFDRQRRIAPWFADTPGVVTVGTLVATQQCGAFGAVIVTHRLLPRLEGQPTVLVLRPPDLVVGIGCNRGTSAEEIATAVSLTLQQAFLAAGSVARLATIDDKADEGGLIAYAEASRLPLDFHGASALNAVTIPSPPSVHALAAVGAVGVCEPAALLSAGSGGTLLVKKQKLGNVTVAVAEIAAIDHPNQTAGQAGAGSP